MNHETHAQRHLGINEDVRRRREWVERVMKDVHKAASSIRLKLSDTAVGTVSAPVGRALPSFWSPAAARLEHRSEYRLADLLAFSDADFVEQCYRIILRRGPDTEGFRHHLTNLYRGATSKTEVLGDIRFSSEGRMHGVHVDGLLIPYTLRRWMKKPLLGKPLRWAYGLIRVGALAERQDILDTAQARETHALGHHLNRFVAAIDERLAAVELESSSKARHDTVRSLSERYDETESLLKAFATNLGSLEQRLAEKVDREAFRDEIAILAERISLIEASSATLLDGSSLQLELSGLLERLQTFESRLHEQIDARREVERRVETFTDELQKKMVLASSELHEKLGELERKAASGEELAVLTDGLAVTGGRLEGLDARLSGVIFEMEAKAGKETRLRQDLDGFYSAFEDSFRGSRELIRERLQPYVQWVRDAQAGSREFPLIDIGCGRGEWLQLLRDHEMVACGVDTNRLFVDMCMGRGLDAEFGDGIAYLDAKAEGSVGAITAMHVVEHLEFETMISMIDSSKRALRSGGLLILETPNPENVMVSACHFYMDPTHRKPIPPIALRWMVEARGFHAVRIERLSHARGMPSWEPPAADVPSAEAITAMSSVFTAAPDYAIVAIRP